MEMLVPGCWEKLTEFVNLVPSGYLPPRIRPVFFGANLIALGKKGGGIRPIAVGNTLRRSSAKCTGTMAKSNRCVECGNVQLGYGTQRGAEAAAHATRLYVRQEHSPDQILLKIDMKNAFNSISREALLATVFAKHPLIYNYTEAASAKPSFLFYRDKIFLSGEGAQQGDPEGPLLFSDTINDTIGSICSKLNLWYLDDGNLAGTFEDVLNYYTTLRSAFVAMGLEVNPQKCELVFLGCPSNEKKQSFLPKFFEFCPGVQVTDLEDLVVLGTPIGSADLESTVEEKTQVFQAFSQKIQRLDAHYALFLIKNCSHMPRLFYVLRTSPCFKLFEKLQRIDNYLRASLESICNVSLSESRDKKVFLLVKLGGMGIPSAVFTAPSTFLAPAVGCEPFSQNLNLNLGSDRDVESALTAWYELSGVDAMPVAKREAQKTWSTPVLDKLQIDIEQSLDQTQSKRFSLTQGRYAGA